MTNKQADTPAFEPLSSAQRVAFLQAQTVAAYAEISGMVAENQFRMLMDQTVSYDEASFDSVIKKYGLDNAEAYLLGSLSARKGGSDE